MSISLDKSPDADFVRFIARFCGVNLGSAASGRLRVRIGKDTELYEPSIIAKYLARLADREKELLGETPFEFARVAMWLDFARNIQRCLASVGSVHWELLESSLEQKTYLGANRVTLADVAVFYVLHGVIRSLSHAQRSQFVNIMRWFDQLQHTVGVRGFRNFDVIDLGHQPIAFTA